ncbi:hypothetical protein DFP72DRAFT_840467 [Ephemerocybe angulata]|uniref:Uncharacterized protein n=1 Tax=Ephemerocybe angulata TaxID=980116 RepID=A0A8H6MDE9_9AGAR|nr:hypothetical protein DFP72DRAFT_840467 [Tulosesus angulatus]
MPEYVVGRVEEAAGPKLRWCQYEVQHVELQRGWWGGRGRTARGTVITCRARSQFEALSSPSLAEVEGAMWSRTRSKSMFDGLGIAIKVELAVRVKRIGNFFSQPRRSLPPNAGRFFALASNNTSTLGKLKRVDGRESMVLEHWRSSNLANSPPAQMDPPDRHGPPRKRDQVKGWLKKHLTGSTTPSPSLSPAPSQTNLSKDQTPRPFPGTAAKAGAGVNVSLMCESPSTGHNFYEGVKTTLRAIERAADVFTPLKSTAAALLVICDTIDAYGKNREEFERLLKRVDVISSIMASWPKDASQGAEDRFSGLSR